MARCRALPDGVLELVVSASWALRAQSKEVAVRTLPKGVLELAVQHCRLVMLKYNWHAVRKLPEGVLQLAVQALQKQGAQALKFRVALAHEGVLTQASSRCNGIVIESSVQNGLHRRLWQCWHHCPLVVRLRKAWRVKGRMVQQQWS